jgi:hypothetical protein
LPPLQQSSHLKHIKSEVINIWNETQNKNIAHKTADSFNPPTHSFTGDTKTLTDAQQTSWQIVWDMTHCHFMIDLLITGWELISATVTFCIYLFIISITTCKQIWLYSN